ncbi:MAG TPA: toxin TcdB middle/N-terminal domain-containing protein, partial [Labilithrix sp.]|nr:toxin TcdB middle/N-terminal domain-containing protein [Labilithrix sp.]
MGLVMWVPDSIPNYTPSPFFLERTLQPSTACEASNGSGTASWRWRRASELDWSQGQEAARPGMTGTNWYTDVDGDGLLDEIVETGEPAVGTVRPARVRFTKRGVEGDRPVQRPFADTNNVPSLTSAEKPGATKYFYADVNGDGLVDLVSAEVDAAAPLGPPFPSGPLVHGIHVRPGDGHGRFACVDAKQGGLGCAPTEHALAPSYTARLVPSTTEQPFLTFFDSESLVHDVTGDGLADIIHYNPSTGDISLWINQNGRDFGCAASGCIVGRTFDDVHSGFTIGPHRVTAADMNADGVDDIVVVSRTGVFVVSAMQRTPDIFAASAPRPGLLTSIDNGHGATTNIQYKTIQQLDVEAERAGQPWDHHSPAVEAVVTQIEARNTKLPNGGTLADPYRFYRVTRYDYRDPAYDRWKRSFEGFRKVRVALGGEMAVTETTYWYSGCGRDSLDPAQQDNVVAVPHCRATRERDSSALADGLPVLVERFIPNLGERSPRSDLWAIQYRYDLKGSAAGTDGRAVGFAYAHSIESSFYDTTRSTSDVPPAIDKVSGGDPLPRARVQDGMKRTRRTIFVDDYGTTVRADEEGLFAEQDTKTVTYLTNRDTDECPGPGSAHLETLGCTSEFECKPTYVVTCGWRAGSGTPEPARRQRFRYEGNVKNRGAVVEVAARRFGALPLNRHHATGGAVANAPDDQVLDSAGDGWAILQQNEYDDLGNLVRTVRGPATSAPECVSIDYEWAYRQWPKLTRRHRAGCGTEALEEAVAYHRGFGVATSTLSPSLGLSTVDLDWFGRPSRVNRPGTDGYPAATAAAVDFSYKDSGPVPYVEVIRFVAGDRIHSFAATNGLGEPVVNFSENDDGSGWSVSGDTKRNANGQVTDVGGARHFPIDPRQYLELGSSLPSNSRRWSIQYDHFGRNIGVYEYAATGGLTPLVTRSYLPLSVIERDAEQQPGGQHASAFTRADYDGHGRVTKTVARTSEGDEVTTVQYAPTGEPLRIARGTASSPDLYVRSLVYDSLGRVVLNEEPNTGGISGWRYAWDDVGRLVGTSDARGCGKNLYYDGLGRMVGEDLSPCLPSHGAYSTPNLATGDGLEAVYRYDAYEAAQPGDAAWANDPLFLDRDTHAAGRLVSVRDRGSHTRFFYDVRGRVRRISRAPAKPAEFAGVGDARYTDNTFDQRIDFDDTDRVVRRTSGAVDPRLLVNGASEERYTYTRRDLLAGITSSYGPIIASTIYDVEGNAASVTYGDIAGTRADFTRDGRSRLKGYKLSRPGTAQWTTPSPTYSLPGADTTPLVLADVRFVRDDVGNPKLIEDLAQLSVPSSAAPVAAQTVAYDDHYRVRSVDSAYATASLNASWQVPFIPEIASGDTRPVPLQKVSTRVRRQRFDYDALGNVTRTAGDTNVPYDRTLGSITHGTSQQGPNQLRAADGVTARYDEAGNLTELKVERASATDCPSAVGSRCAQWFVYEWNEVGELERARRWDFAGGLIPPHAPGTLPASAPSWELKYAYSMGSRILKTARDSTGAANHTVDVFDTMRLRQTSYDPSRGKYNGSARFTRLSLAGGTAQIVTDGEGTLPQANAAAGPVHMFLTFGDHLGS